VLDNRLPADGKPKAGCGWSSGCARVSPEQNAKIKGVMYSMNFLTTCRALPPRLANGTSVSELCAHVGHDPSDFCERRTFLATESESGLEGTSWIAIPKEQYLELMTRLHDPIHEDCSTVERDVHFISMFRDIHSAVSSRLHGCAWHSAADELNNSPMMAQEFAQESYANPSADARGDRNRNGDRCVAI